MQSTSRLKLLASRDGAGWFGPLQLPEWFAPISAPSVVINGTEGDDILTGTAGDDQINALGGNDTASGLDGSDTIDGGDGDDTIFDSGGFLNVIFGGAGVDTITLTGGSGSNNSVDAGDGNDTITADAGQDSVGGGAGDDFISTGAGSDVLVGGDGIDTMIAGAGIDRIEDNGLSTSIDAGGDDDSITIVDLPAGSIDGGTGVDELNTNGSMTFGTLTLLNIEILNTRGSRVAGTPTQFEQFEIIRVNDVNPSAGVSLALIAPGIVDLANELAGVTGFTFFEGSTGNDSIKLGTGPASIQAGAGDDVIFDGPAGDALSGGAGNDMVQGGGGHDAISGDAGDDVLFGNVGSDSLDGGEGVDQMFGGEGDDSYTVDNSNDLALEANAAWGIDLVFASASYALGQNIENLMLTGSAVIATGNALPNVLTGNALANALFGRSGNDSLNGAGGADQMFGGEGDDTYFVDDVADLTFEAQSSWGNDTVYASVSYQIGQNIDNLGLFIGAGALTGRGNLLDNALTGNESANTLFGFAGNDTLDGGLGADQLYGREGNDTYIVDNVGDVVAEANAAWGTDTIQASVTYFLAPNLENLTLTGGAAINGNGNSLANFMLGNGAANTLFGFAGADVLDGGAGADSMFGGEGDDLYIVDHAGDVGFEASAAWGTDLVQTSVSHALGANLDNLTLTGAAAINGTGNNLANVLTGNGAANQLFGLAGADTLAGGAGNDALDGGAGDDAFVFAPGSGADTVAGFVAGGAEDSIDLAAYNGSGVTWTVTQSGADTIFAFTNGDQITLTNVTAANLVQTDPFGYS